MFPLPVDSLLSVVEEDVRLRNVSHLLMISQEKRHTLELLLREEEEFLKLQMYLRDDRFRDLEKMQGTVVNYTKLYLICYIVPCERMRKCLPCFGTITNLEKHLGSSHFSTTGVVRTKCSNTLHVAGLP